MCGRFTLDAPPEALVEQFGIEQPPALTARYNIAPSQLVAVVGKKADGVRRGLALVRWGLVPDWSNDPKHGPINARAETVAGLPTFADSFRQRRCIIPASGFYEWRAEGKKKLPHHIRLKGGGVMGFAGLWSVWRDGTDDQARPLVTCCVVTVPANELVRPLHDRMPAILGPEDHGRWLDNDTPLKELHALLKPYPAELMEVAEANPLVNSPKNEGPKLLDPAA
jgi:putative SOS response-associated peptidase YedK